MMEVKQISTGDNDSVEEALIAIRNIKTVDGKYLSPDIAWKAVEGEWNRPLIFDLLEEMVKHGKKLSKTRRKRNKK